MSDTTVVDDRILALLDRLDPSLDEPCDVAECAHLHALLVGAP